MSCVSICTYSLPWDKSVSVSTAVFSFTWLWATHSLWLATRNEIHWRRSDACLTRCGGGPTIWVRWLTGGVRDEEAHKNLWLHLNCYIKEKKCRRTLRHANHQSIYFQIQEKKKNKAAVLVLQSPSQMHQLDSWPRQQVAVEAFLVHGWLHKFSNTSQWPPPHIFSPWGYSNRTSLLWFTQMHKFCLLGTTPAVNTSLKYLWVLSKMSLPKYIRMYY